jgi:hypothetical protein
VSFYTVKDKIGGSKKLFLSLKQNTEAKKFARPGIVACAVIPLMGGWTLRTFGL